MSLASKGLRVSSPLEADWLYSWWRLSLVDFLIFFLIFSLSTCSCYSSSFRTLSSSGLRKISLTRYPFLLLSLQGWMHISESMFLMALSGRSILFFSKNCLISLMFLCRFYFSFRY